MRIRIDNADDRAVGRRVFSFEWEARLFTSAPEHQLAHTGAHRINCDHRFAVWFEVLIQGLNDQKFATFERIVFDGGDYGSDNACQLHRIYGA